MEELEVVIKIPKKEYKKIIEYGECDYLRVINAIENGMLLSEGHGRIGDLDAVMSDISTSINEMTNIGVAVDDNYLWAKLNDAIDNAQTFIEPNKKNEVRENLADPKEVPDINIISAKSVVDTLRAIEYGYSGYSIKNDRLEGAYVLASELTGLSIDTLSSYVNSGATKGHIEEKDELREGFEEPEEDMER